MLVLILTFLVTLVCVLFGTVLGVKMVHLFDEPWMFLTGPVAALLIGVGFGLTHLPLLAGLFAGLVGAVGSVVALYRW